MKTQTNKALVKQGFNAEMIGQVLEVGLLNETELLHSVLLTGDEEGSVLYFQDFKEREFEIIIYDEEPETLYMSTRNIEDEDFEEKNKKSFKSIGALLNNVLKMAEY